MQVNLSDINHELGKAKESLVHETGNYFGNSQVGSLIRSESTKFSNILGAKSKDPPSLPKSTSLPVIQGQSPDQFRRPRGRSGARNLGSKYKYRSSYCEDEEDAGGALSPGDMLDEDCIVNRFIKVVGSDQDKISQVSIIVLIFCVSFGFHKSWNISATEESHHTIHAKKYFVDKQRRY